MQTMEFHEDCFVQQLNEFFTTFKRADPLNKYEIKFTVKSKKDKIKIIKKKKNVKEITP
jgi:hypothetical protein